ncbi:MAG: hypothetical protein E6J90_38170 [Deltaproteobacteria bacterium]|nr:MAG: hypothetical protein E6J90_38170 [Deltaproteobacteria bacterium]
MSRAAQLVMISQYGSDGVSDSPKQRLANAVIENTADPRRFTPSIAAGPSGARKLVAELTGQSWQRHVLGGMLRIGSAQLQRLLGAGPARV